MKFSIITPTHKITPYLEELYNSLVEQTYEDWEWVVYLNGSADIKKIDNQLKNDSRVRIIESGLTSNSIGFIKNKAFYAGQGDILVEVDHDDWLHENCLEKLAEAFSDDEVGFVYSNAILYDQRGQEEKLKYNALNGWNDDWVEYEGEEYYAPDTFKPTSRSLCYIWYAPDHVRAWRSSVYHELEGHDRDYSVCDDHELLIRTYLNTKMVHIPEPLYYYRLQGEDNTYIDRNAEIQKTTKELFLKYARTLAEHDADKAELLKVDIGGGLFAYPGYTTIDQREEADITCDLNDGIPLPDNSVGVLNASHVIEHLRDPVKTMSEIHRVLCDGGWAFIDVPSTDGRGAFQDPTHVSFWNENSFWYYTRRQQAQFIDNTTIRFQAFRLETLFESEWDRQHNIPVVKAVLCAVKSDERRPHTLEI
jgi:glycosyltransferase involved in cell wall biosynthesis